MSIFQLRFVSAGLLLLLIFPSGLFLSHAGKPYNAVLFNLHKLIGLGLFVFLAATMYRIDQAAPLNALELTLCLISGLLFLITIVSGGLVSLERSLPAALSIGHKLFPYLTVLSTTLTMYLLLSRR